MTESSSCNDRLTHSILQQISQAIDELVEWNTEILCANDYRTSPEGMKTLAATSMLLEAVGEGIERINIRTQGKLLVQRPEIPWEDIIGMRNHIAHGYFDLDADLVFDADYVFKMAERPDDILSQIGGMSF